MTKRSADGNAFGFVANCSLLFTELPLLDRPSAARAAGFDAIELWWPFATASPPGESVDRLVDAIIVADIPLIGLNFFAGDMPRGDRGLVSWTGREHEFRDNIEVVVDIALRLGTRLFNALYGNVLDGVHSDIQRGTALANLDIAARAVVEFGGTVLLEPLSGSPKYPLRTARDVTNIIGEYEKHSSLRNVKLLADIYHLTVNGDNYRDVLTEYSHRIGHIQFADAPGRHEPGTGQIDFSEMLSRVRESGYRSWIAAEYIPSDTTESSLAWLDRPDA